MDTPEQILEVLKDIEIGPMSFSNWVQRLRPNKDGIDISLLTDVRCFRKGLIVPLGSGYRSVETRFPERRVIETVFSIADEMLRHELREHFKYKGSRFFNPHTRPDLVLGVCEVES